MVSSSFQMEYLYTMELYMYLTLAIKEFKYKFYGPLSATLIH